MSRWGSHNKYSKMAISNNFVPWKHGHIVAIELSRAQLWLVERVEERSNVVIIPRWVLCMSTISYQVTEYSYSHCSSCFLYEKDCLTRLIGQIPVYSNDRKKAFQSRGERSFYPRENQRDSKIKYSKKGTFVQLSTIRRDVLYILGTSWSFSKIIV